MYMIAVKFGDYDLATFKRQPGWWVKNIWKHMMAEAQGENMRNARAAADANPHAADLPR